MDITAEEVDTRWPYRAGYPRLLRPPVKFKDIDKESNPIPEAKFEALKSYINTIIDLYHIPRGPHSPEVVYRAQRWGNSMLPRVIVDCVYEKGKSDSKMWARAVTEIYTAAKHAAKEGREIGVELCDRRFTSTSHICTPPDSGSLKENWNEGLGYRHQILQLFDNLPTMFQVMIPVGRCAAGWREYEWTTVILFEAMNAEDVAWDSLEGGMRSILPDGIDIEIRQRVTPLFCGGIFENAAHKKLDLAKYVRPPKPGCEISQQNNPSAGTMGGYVITEAADTKKRTTFGVTNAHVALASYKEASFDAPVGEGISIQSPGAYETMQFGKELLEEIAKTEKIVQGQREIVEAVQGSEPVLCQQFREKLKINEPKLASLKEGFQLVQNSLSIGLVHKAILGCRGHTVSTTTSTTTETTETTDATDATETTEITTNTKLLTTTKTSRRTKKLMMDLALIRMDCLADTRPQEIYWQENATRPLIWENTTCNFWDVDSLGNSQKTKEHIKVIARLSRSGSYTMGIVSDFRAVAVFGEDDQPGSWKVEAWAITCPRRMDSLAEATANQWLMGKKWHRFAEAGDSGSFVIAAAGWEYDGQDNRITMLPSRQEAFLDNGLSHQPFIVGLLFAASTDSGLAYFIPFDAVKSEIESMTGEKLVWPQKRSEALQEAKASLPGWL